MTLVIPANPGPLAWLSPRSHGDFQPTGPILIRSWADGSRAEARNHRTRADTLAARIIVALGPDTPAGGQIAEIVQITRARGGHLLSRPGGPPFFVERGTCFVGHGRRAGKERAGVQVIVLAPDDMPLDAFRTAIESLAGALAAGLGSRDGVIQLQRGGISMELIRLRPP